MALSSCVSLEDIQASCADAGHAAGSQTYADCVQFGLIERQARREGIRQGLQGFDRAAQQLDPIPAQTAAPLNNSGPVCFASGEYASGFNKICEYDCLGSPYAITIGSAELCPLTVQGR